MAVQSREAHWEKTRSLMFVDAGACGSSSAFVIHMFVVQLN